MTMNMLGPSIVQDIYNKRNTLNTGPYVQAYTESCEGIQMSFHHKYHTEFSTHIGGVNADIADSLNERKRRRAYEKNSIRTYRT